MRFQIKANTLTVEVQRAHLESTQLEWRSRSILQGKDDLHDRVTVELPLWRKFINQSLKGKILVRICIERDLLYAIKQLRKGWVPREVDAKGKRINKESYQWLN